MKKVVGVVLGLLPVSVSAQCITPPDCALIGYTETSCEGDSLKCPFDATKLKCFPCDSSFRYTFSGDNIKNPIGDSCNNKYVSCECNSPEYIFINSECICDTRCNVGAIYYSDGTCNHCLIEGKNPVGIVVKDNDLIMNLDFQYTQWAPNNINMENIVETSDTTDAQNQKNGYFNYFPTNLEESKNQWYLPAAGELYNYLGLNYETIKYTWNKLNINYDETNHLWTSTEAAYHYGWIIKPSTAHLLTFGASKTASFLTTCFLSIKK